MKNVGKRYLTLFVATLCGASLLAGCAQPAPQKPLGSVDALQIMAPEGNVEAFVLSKLYETALDERGRTTTLTLEKGSLETQLDSLRSGATDLVMACSGELLDYYNPGLAEELKADYAKQDTIDKNSGEWRETVYDALQGSLPNSLVATDPSNALGCAGDKSLPQNIVPIYRKPNLSRDERQTLNFVSGALDTETLSEMVQETKDSGEVRDSALSFLRSKGF